MSPPSGIVHLFTLLYDDANCFPYFHFAVFFCLVIMGFILKKILHALLGELMESVGDSLLAASHCHS